MSGYVYIFLLQETLHAAEMKKMKLQQSLLCRKVKELEQTMMEL